MARRPARKKAATAPRRTWRRWLFAALALLAVAAAFFFLLAPGIAERSMNRLEGSGLWRVEPRVAALHEDLLVADLHADTLLWSRELSRRGGRGHADLPRLMEGNVGLQVFASVTEVPPGLTESGGHRGDLITPLVVAQMQPPRTWNSRFQRALFHAGKLERAARANPARLKIVRTRADLEDVLDRREGGQPVLGAVLALEGLQSIEGRIVNLERLFAAGFRIGGLVHLSDNAVAGSRHGSEKGGLTALGRQTVRRMEALGMIVDISHLSETATAETLAMARRPVIASHGGARGICDHERNLSDAEIRGVAAIGGLIGVGFWPDAVCGATPQATARTMRYVRDLVGIEHVALGSDFDGAVTTGFDAAGMAAVTQALADQGFSERQIRLAMGGNVARLLMENLPAR